MAVRRRYIREWYIETDVNAHNLGHAEFHIATPHETFVLVVDGRSSFYHLTQALKKTHREWLEDVVAVEGMLASELRTNV